MFPKVSIVIPVYNVEKYLKRCTDSVLAQTLTDIEIIIVDDGSPDNCPKMCDEIAQKDTRVKVIHKQNEGLGMARNSGMDIAKGEYIAFIDSDDYIEIEMMATLYNIASQKQMQAVYCGVNMIDGTGNSIGKRIEVDKYTEFIGYGSCRHIGLNMIAPTNKYGRGYMTSVWHSIFNLKFLRDNNIRFCSERDFKSEDMIFDIDLFSYASRVAFIPNAYYNYCFNSESLSRAFKTNLYDRTRVQYFEMLRRLKVRGYDDFGRGVVHKYMIVKTRSFLRLIVLNGVAIKEKRRLIERVINDEEVWNGIKCSDVLNILSLKQKLFYFLILHKWIGILSIVDSFANKLKF